LDILGTVPCDESAKHQKEILSQKWNSRKHNGKHALFRTIVS